MAHHGVRLDAEGTPQGGQRDHHGEQGRLNHFDAVQFPANHLEQREVHVRSQRLGAFAHPVGENR